MAHDWVFQMVSISVWDYISIIISYNKTHFKETPYPKPLGCERFWATLMSCGSEEEWLKGK